MSLNFRIVEGDHEDYWDTYEEFISLYNANLIPVTKIREKLNLTVGHYNRFRERALEENRISLDVRNPSIRMKHNPKSFRNYYKTSQGYQVVKTVYGKTMSYGYYKTEEDAKKVVAALRKCNWNKHELLRITRELGV